MNDEVHFAAPWSSVVKVVTPLVVLLLIGMAILEWTILPARTPQIARLLLTAAPLAVPLGTLPFMVRGYALRGRQLVIQRLGWANHIGLEALVSATAEPEAMSKSIRLFGCGGLFGFFGSFRNRNLGTYHAYCTDPKRAVVLKFPSRTVVVTPDNPQKFVSDIDSLRTAT